MANNLLSQGLHPDPATTPLRPSDRARWTQRQRRAFDSREMELFRAALTLPPRDDVRAGILDDLSTFYGYPPEECVERCLHWEELSTREWQSADRTSRDGLLAFYNSTTSWSFDLLWYAYLQAEGLEYPVHVAMAQTSGKLSHGRRHLDFGSGVGVTSQLFSALGYTSTLADVSQTLMAFARFRLERRGVEAGYIDLNVAGLPAASFDVITAADTLAHVPDVAATAAMLHSALAPGGLLFANFDVRPKTPENAWHLYDDDLPLRWKLQRAGFEPVANLDGRIIAYRRVATGTVAHAAHGIRDVVALRSPARPAYRRLRGLSHRVQSRARAHTA